MIKIFKYLKLKEWIMLLISVLFIVLQVWLDLKLPDYIQTAIASGEITERHARALLKVDKDKLEEVFKTIIQRGYNVKKTEEYISALNDKDKVKVRGISSSVQLGVNTIKQSYDLCKKTGLDVDYNVTEYENEVKITIRFKKPR